MKHRKALDAARAHAVAQYPNESCGLIIKTGPRKTEYVPCPNVATTPSQHFMIAPLDWRAAEDRGEVVAVVHSHPDGPSAFSPGDVAACEASELLWYLIRVDKADDGPPVATETLSLAPTGVEFPLLGRPFAYGTLDCWGLVRDFYAREMDIGLPNFYRGLDGWWQDLESDFDPYDDEKLREAAGLVKIYGYPEQVGDIVVMQVRSKSGKPNHVGVLLDTSRGTMLHHLYGALSERVVYGGYWRETTRFILRHKSNVPDHSRNQAPGGAR